MKKILFLSLFATTALFADMITIDNQTSYIDTKSKGNMGIQWAASSQELNQKSIATMYQNDEQSDLAFTKKGKNQIKVPSNAKYFRICVWTSGSKTPEYVTSWILVVPNKNYTLQQKNLYPAVLSSGSGC